jgi:NAD-dependent dihydropyrimidine dehydrogenase PreA subunit
MKKTKKKKSYELCKYCREMPANKRIRITPSLKYPLGIVRMCAVCALMLPMSGIRFDLNRLKMANEYERAKRFHDETGRPWRKGRPRWLEWLDGTN